MLPIKKLFKSRFSFKVRQRGQQQLYIRYKVCWILCKVVDAPSLSWLYLCIQPTLQSPPNICSSISVGFYLPISPLLIHKIILTISTYTPFLYTSAIFQVSIFTYNHANNPHQKHFPYLSHLANSGCVKGQGS